MRPMHRVEAKANGREPFGCDPARRRGRRRSRSGALLWRSRPSRAMHASDRPDPGRTGAARRADAGAPARPAAHAARTVRSSADVAPAGSSARASLLRAAVCRTAPPRSSSAKGVPSRVRVGAGWRQLTVRRCAAVAPRSGTSCARRWARRCSNSSPNSTSSCCPWQCRRTSGAGSATAFRQFDGVAVRVTFVAGELADDAAAGRCACRLGRPRPIGNGKGLVLCVGERGIGRGELLSSLVTARPRSTIRATMSSWSTTSRSSLPTDGALIVRRRYGVDPVHARRTCCATSWARIPMRS